MKGRYLFPALLYMGLIWFVSSQPGDELSLPRFWDKPAHFLEYAPLGVLVFLGAGGKGRGLAAAAAVALAYGIVDELHQSFVPNRDPSPFDVMTDVAGASAGAWAARLWEKRRPTGGRP